MHPQSLTGKLNKLYKLKQEVRELEDLIYREVRLLEETPLEDRGHDSVPEKLTAVSSHTDP